MAPLRIALVLALTLCGLGFGRGGARADGDPASDVLLGQDVYYPYSPAVSADLQRSLDTMTAAARRSGFPVKIAIIDQPTDLGVIPDLFNRPKPYAQFLVREITYQDFERRHLLVVMPSGFGTAGMPAAADAAVAGAPKPTGIASDDLARAAVTALSRLATAAGHPLKVSGASGAGSSGGSAVLVVALALVALLAVAGLILLRRRRSPPR